MNTSDADFVFVQSALAGEYSLEREIGRGGMGIVYLAREVGLGRSVAIKVLLPSLASNAELRAAFLHEARTVAQLNHPNIISIHTAGERGRVAFIAMTFVDGATLGQHIRARGPMSVAATAQMLREVCWALAYAHSTGIVHRDISAENVMIERGTSRAIVMDFGIASAMQMAAVSADGHVLGNARYISPEQAAGDPVDARSDIYSLGVCAYYALTGKLPFDAVTPAAIVQQHLSLIPPPVNAVVGSVPPRLGQAIDRALAKDPARRPQSAENFAEAIDLAANQVRAIPTPLRTWISQGEREGPFRVALLGIGVALGSAAFALTHNPAMFFWPFPLVTISSFLPSALRLRRVVTDGYDAEDIYSALKEHAIAREEEVAYERTASTHRLRRLLWLLFGGSVFMSLYLAQRVAVLAPVSTALARGYLGGTIQTIFLMGISGVLLIADYSRMHLSARATKLKLSFWQSKWGSRAVRLLGLGTTAGARPVDALPLTTEIALGRATDHLFQALPNPVRKQLAILPDLVRRLEQDASLLRVRVEDIDQQLGVFDRTAQTEAGGSMESDLREMRVETAAKLSASVGALEGIRLGLLRLQMGTSDVISVTAELDAARALGDELSLAAHAREEVEQLLRTTNHANPLLDSLAEDDDADTPVGGVPATRR